MTDTQRDPGDIFYEVLERSTVGQEINLELYREGQERGLRARAEEIPGSALSALADRMLGMSLRPGEPRGLVVESVRSGSGAERIGIEVGDRILGINGRALEDEDDLRRTALELRGRTRALVVVQRGRGRYHVTVPLS